MQWNLLAWQGNLLAPNYRIWFLLIAPRLHGKKYQMFAVVSWRSCWNNIIPHVHNSIHTSWQSFPFANHVTCNCQTHNKLNWIVNLITYAHFIVTICTNISKCAQKHFSQSDRIKTKFVWHKGPIVYYVWGVGVVLVEALEYAYFFGGGILSSSWNAGGGGFGLTHSCRMFIAFQAIEGTQFSKFFPKLMNSSSEGGGILRVQILGDGDPGA